MNEVMEEESSTDDEVEEEDILMLQVSRNETPIYKKEKIDSLKSDYIIILS